MLCITLLMRPFGLRDRELDEEQRQHREDERLHEADKHLKSHQWRREDIRYEVAGDHYQHFACENVSKETARERNEPTKVADERDKPDGKPDLGFKINILPRICGNTKHRDACNLNGEEGDECEREGEIEVGGCRAQKRQEF